jgi:type VI secretion system protein ImpL
MIGTLKSLSGTTDYGYAYDTLKAYLITTSNHDKSSKPFLSPALTTRWAGGRPADPEQSRLAALQFDFYSDELLRNPAGFSTANDADTVAGARAYLSAFAGADRVYPVMLAEAGKSNPPVNFNKKFPGSSEVVINNKDVPGAFTKAGWTFMQNAIKNAESFFSREEWVLGSSAGAKKGDARLEQDLRARYYADFIAQWQDYLKKSVVVPYKGFADAARKLGRIDGPQSPLLALFWLASQNTGVDAPDVVKAFKPLHAVMPPASVDQYIGPGNADYMKALVPLQVALEQIAALPPAQAEQAAEQTRSAASAAKLVTRQMALTQALDQTMLKLLEDPITHAVGAIPAPPAPGKGMCAEFKALSGMYPFRSEGPRAKLEDLAAFFAPKGALWTFYEQNLKKALTPRGGGYVPADGVTPPAPAGVVRFFNRAASFSKALYPDGSANARLTFSVKPVIAPDVQSLHLEIEGQAADFTSAGAVFRFNWPGAAVHGVRLNAKWKDGAGDYPSYGGLWGLFEFFSEADVAPSGPGTTFGWMLRGGRQGRFVTSPATGQPRQVQFDVDMLGGPPVFQKGYFASFGCSESK